MSTHKSNFGSFGDSIIADDHGYAATDETESSERFHFDHGSEDLADDNGNLTEYGAWWEDEGFPEWRSESIASVEAASTAIDQWRSESDQAATDRN